MANLISQIGENDVVRARAQCMAHTIYDLSSVSRIRSDHVCAHTVWRLQFFFFFFIFTKIINLQKRQQIHAVSAFRMIFFFSLAVAGMHIVEFWQFSCVANARYGKPLWAKRMHKMLAARRYTDSIKRCQFQTLLTGHASQPPLALNAIRTNCTFLEKRVRELPTQMTRSTRLFRIFHSHCVRHTLARSLLHTAAECPMVS